MAHQSSRSHNQSPDPLTRGTSEGSSKRNIIRKASNDNRERKASLLNDHNDENDFRTGEDDPNDPNYDLQQPPIFHMCDEADFDEQTQDGGLYYPPTYQQDKFIHATESPGDLLNVGNHFYKSAKGKWICLKIDAAGLKVVYELPMSVGDKESHTKADDSAPLFPHIYCGLLAQNIVQRYDIVRGADGSFDAIVGLV